MMLYSPNQGQRSRGAWGGVSPPPIFPKKNKDLLRESVQPPPPHFKSPPPKRKNLEKVPPSL